MYDLTSSRNHPLFYWLDWLINPIQIHLNSLSFFWFVGRFQLIGYTRVIPSHWWIETEKIILWSNWKWIVRGPRFHKEVLARWSEKVNYREESSNLSCFLDSLVACALGWVGRITKLIDQPISHPTDQLSNQQINIIVLQVPAYWRKSWASDE